jgi:hypothetical protein
VVDFQVSYCHYISSALISGGFVPREPILDGPFYESKYEVPYQTTGLSILDVHMPVDITVGTVIPPSITVLPERDNGKYFAVKLNNHVTFRAKFFLKYGE